VASLLGLLRWLVRLIFDKTVEYWQQDKWTGCFPVKWHIVKDIHNNLLKHIILEYNENKPVTNSRDTQEVRIVDLILSHFRLCKVTGGTPWQSFSVCLHC
jgi:hypothetical protein